MFRNWLAASLSLPQEPPINLYDAFDGTVADAAFAVAVPQSDAYSCWDLVHNPDTEAVPAAAPATTVTAYSTFEAPSMLTAVMTPSASVAPPPLPPAADDGGGLEEELLQAAAVDWTAQLDAALQMPSSDTTQRLAKATAIFSVVRRFTATCERLAQVIIADVWLPPTYRRIPPLAGAGGVAGGEKYLCGNIFLKFARDFHGVYGSDRGSAKSGVNGLRSFDTGSV
jgi:hypothetical protein